MIEKIKLRIDKYRELLMYIFIGGCTTLVNLIVYSVMCKYLKFDVNISNIVSIIISIIFAFVTNKIFVFKSKSKTLKELVLELIKFISSRFFTMLIEIYGVYFLVVINNYNEIFGKIKIQIIVLIINYLMSKYIIFKK